MAVDTVDTAAVRSHDPVGYAAAAMAEDHDAADAARSTPALRVRLTRVSNTRHRMQVVRADGSAESCELETRSCLLHDLVHFAVETEARLARSFYGLLAAGMDHRALMHDLQPADATELIATERVIGPLTNAWQKGIDPPGFVAALRAYGESTGAPMPDWLDEDLVARALERLRRLEGRWRATAFGEAMELLFEFAAGTDAPIGAVSG